MSWAQLLRIADGPPSDALRALGNAGCHKGRKGITLSTVVRALRRAALRLDLPGIDRSDYTRARELIVAPSQRAGHAATAERVMAPLNQIETVLNQHGITWNDALAHAGLARPPQRISRRGIDELAAVRLFVASLGKRPSGVTHLRDWAKGRRISISHQSAARLEHAVATIQAERRARRAAASGREPTRADSSHAASTTSNPKHLGGLTCRGGSCLSSL